MKPKRLSKDITDVKPLQGEEIPKEVFERLKELITKEHGEVQIVFSRHLMTPRPEVEEDEHRKAVCGRCGADMNDGMEEDRVFSGDVCSDGQFYCMECIAGDQCGCLPRE